MYQGPKAVGILVGVVIGIGAAVGCGDDGDDGAALKAGEAEAATVAPQQKQDTTYEGAGYKSQIRDAADSGSLAGTTGDNSTDTRAGAGFKLTYEKSGSAD
jgi:hypothetical protein